MHDPKLTATVANHPIMLSESLLDQLHFSGHHHAYMDTLHHAPAHALALPLVPFSSISPSYPEVSLDGRLQFFPRLKEVDAHSDLLQLTGYESAFSEVAAGYRYLDILHSRRLYETLHGGTSLSLPTNMGVTSRSLSGDYQGLLRAGGGRDGRSGVVIRDLSSLSPSLPPPAALPSSRSTHLSLTPLHVSTVLASPASPPMSSASSPSPLRRSSVSPDCPWSDRPKGARPSLMSSLSVPADLTLYKDRLCFHPDRTFPALPLLTPHLWPAAGLYGPPGLYQHPSARFESGSDLGHTSSGLVPRPLRHHMHLHPLLKASFYEGSSCSDARSSPGKELPTKLQKLDRLRDRQDLTSALDADRGHSERLSSVKKSASTQTQFSSFPCDVSLAPPPYFSPHDTLSTDRVQASPTHGHVYPGHLPPALPQYSHTYGSPPTYPPPPPPPPAFTPSCPSPPTTPTLPQIRRCSPITTSYPPARSPPPPPQYPSQGARGSAEVQHAPLNLSLSSGSGVTPATVQCVKALSSRPGGHHSDTPAQVSDEAIEEHFRRSLGKSYSEPVLPKQVAVHMTDKISSVDDHFARALGDQTWTQIKARNEAVPLESLPGSVDAHFAKALGAAMWKKLQSETKMADDVVCPGHQPHPSSAEASEDLSSQQTSPHSLQSKPLVT